jgi:hypothetical protein
MQHPKYKSNLGSNKLAPQVGCAACHDAHIVAPSVNADVDNTVEVTDSVTSSSGSVTVLAVTPATGRSVSYREYRPFRLADNEAQNAKNGMWSRGSAFTRPNRTIVNGQATIDAVDPTILTYTAGGFTTTNIVHINDTVFISGTASTTAQLPSAAVNAGEDVTVTVTLTQAGFNVEEVIDDETLKLSPGVATTGTVTYTRATPPPATGTLSVPVQFGGTVDFEVRNMNTNAETLCGSCHTKGNYKFSAWGKLGSSFIDLKSTHNNDILTQYKSAGHADIQAPAWEEFSARPYGGSHTTVYPFDMSIDGSGANGSLRNGGNTLFTLTSAVPDTNAYLSASGNTSLPRLVNNYSCFQCHNGISAIDYMKNVQGTANAQVLWGDATVTCITCHDTHDQGAGANIRVPTNLSYHSIFTPTGRINKFLDGTDIPAGVGTGIVCLFCHQGRESGLTVFKAIIANANPALPDPYADMNRLISAAGVSFTNPHYLDSGAILWSKNAWEYLGREYSEGIPAHQNLNCAGCHMAEANAGNTEGGHTWKPRLETCQECHGDVAAIEDIPAIGDYDGSGGTPGTAFEEFGTIDPDPQGSGTGLYGRIRDTLAGLGIFYNPDRHPYFFTTDVEANQTSANAFKAWTTNTLSAAFNLSWAYKSGNCVPYHNAWYGAQILQDSLVALGVDTTDYFRPDIFNRTANDYRMLPTP